MFLLIIFNESRTSAAGMSLNKAQNNFVVYLRTALLIAHDRFENCLY